MSDLLALLGELAGAPVPLPRAPRRARTRCADPLCLRPVYVDQLVHGYGHCCAEKRGLIVRRHRLRHDPPGTGAPTLFDTEEPVEPFPQARIEVAGMTPADAHAAVLKHVREVADTQNNPQVARLFDPSVNAAATAQFDGLAAILERHAPAEHSVKIDPRSGEPCEPMALYGHGQPAETTAVLCAGHLEIGAGRARYGYAAWPCDDYRNAAAGFAIGLPEAAQ